MKRICFLLIILISGAFWSLISPVLVHAANIDVVGKAKVLNTSAYLDFNASPYNSNVKINNATGDFSGYAWMEDLGWVAFGMTDNPSGPVTVDLHSGVVSGKALVIDTGAYLDFTGIVSSNVVINIPDGVFSGYAWSEDVGWVDFASTGVFSPGLDAIPPVLSASNGSSTWVNAQLSATVAATDNIALAEVRYNWSSNVMNEACTTGGTVTTNSAVLNAPAGGTVLYLCARDTTGNVATWHDTYNWEDTSPSIPGVMHTTWDGDHYVKTGFTATSTGSTDTGGSGLASYSLFRSMDYTDTSDGCDISVEMGLETASVVVSGSDLPANGYRRDYCWLATDGAGNISDLSTAVYIWMDDLAPTTAVTITDASYNPATFIHNSIINGTASDGSGSGVDTVDITLYNGTNYWTGSTWGASTWLTASTSEDKSTWTYSIDDSNFADGLTYTVRARATDIVGNTTSSGFGTDSFAYTTVEPTPPVTETPTPTVTPTVTPTETPTETPTLTPSITPTVTPTVTVTITPIITPTITPTVTPSVSLTVTPTLSPSPTVQLTPTVTLTPTPTNSPTPTPTVTPTPTAIPTPTPTDVATPTPTIVNNTSPTNTVTPVVTTIVPTAHTIFDVQVTQYSGSIQICWKTNTSSTGYVKYGNSAGQFTSTSLLETNPVTQHCRIITIANDSTVIYYQIIDSDTGVGQDVYSGAFTLGINVLKNGTLPQTGGSSCVINTPTVTGDTTNGYQINFTTDNNAQLSCNLSIGTVANQLTTYGGSFKSSGDHFNVIIPASKLPATGTLLYQLQCGNTVKTCSYSNNISINSGSQGVSNLWIYLGLIIAGMLILGVILYFVLKKSAKDKESQLQNPQLPVY